MKISSGLAVVLFGLLLYLLPVRSHAQVITAGPDSVETATLGEITIEGDSTERRRFFLSGLRNLSKPGRAALYSAIIPGMGQAYNRAYWKMPIVYATGVVCGYFLVTNNSTYQSLRYAYLARSAGEPTDQYADHPVLGVDRANGTSSLKYFRDYYRRNRDLTIILSVVAYGLNIAEAYVHAHLKDFDVSNDLSIRVQPNLINIPATTNYTPGLSLTLYTR
ncbi:DUF5683 domain-containing protein [Pontibacter sp. SGAir0037]|uniref:DUF5683 domain-containing protein n=1 Tax=Pontibacter sp. SGAir0037 TaxID=2571030 RepID=UPI0010CD66AC|nr:DUF5683 domain-containing protein [Pontibacter sp. SGAir0037]QCR22051.1 hypothetical protein C1N53_06660 [Pontibacter sp. SGAir0037]